ncbi:uncharacterized protein LOC110055564 isoform X2 [Orbicella faveolata]|uniref:uncharacterized protein LOC110055564 isoform X2 n=1 Tax=Orbicella faveolata TaxID=48498 RepID=UPI0009E27900|nr:uncharacterized protein LOC110055564 isoform X2 [Orbicella faveolata]
MKRYRSYFGLFFLYAEQYQDVLSCLTLAIDMKSLKESAERAIHLLLPRVVDVVVFVLSPVSDDLEALRKSGSSTPVTIPASGLARFVMTGH